MKHTNFKKTPYSLSLSPKMIKKLKYWKYSNINGKLSQRVEAILDNFFPDVK